VIQVVEHYQSNKLKAQFKPCRVPVAHACTPSYSGRDQEEVKATLDKWFVRPYLEKNTITKKGWWSGPR
jgi:hypothetical protein